MKIRLRRVRLNNGGYDSQGHYYGIGAPLYRWSYEDKDGYEWDYDIRASDRDDAKDKLRRIYSTATFYR